MTDHLPERAVARIDLAAVTRNCEHIRSQLSEPTELCAVVKANAYGHGDIWCANAALAGGATWLAVAAASEAAELRRHGVDARILVMGALTAEDARMAIEAMADVVAWEPEFVPVLAAAADRLGLTARVHLKLDSGMGRLGSKDPAVLESVAELISNSKNLELAGFMTHFATADERDNDFFDTQLERFAEWVEPLRAKHPEALVHAANSPGTLRASAAHFDMVRCGVAIYGLDPYQEDPFERGLEPALQLESYVAAARRFGPGDSAGYGRTWAAADPTWVGTLPIGYGDGWRRALSNNADVLLGGRRHPLVGTVSMDNITVDLGPDTDVEPGAVAVLIGAQGSERILCEEVARRAGTINYDITCGLTQRVRRVWSAQE